MATSQNGWSVYVSPPDATIDGYITGRIRPGDVDTVFTYLCDRIHKEVEEIKPHWSWGWAFRAIRGSSSGYSNHASATAIDINAPAHPLGVTGTWTRAELDKVHSILEDMDGIIRWGEDYSNRKDGMHFEINASAKAVAAVAKKIRAKKMPDQETWRPKKAKAVHFGRVQEQFLIALGHQEGEIRQLNGVGLIQRALNKVLHAENITVDGWVGKQTLDAWGRFEKGIGVKGRPRVPDRKSVEALAEKAGLRIVGEPWD